jgi:hypothetical protein
MLGQTPGIGTDLGFLKGFLVNCLQHFFLYFFCSQIKFPQLFAMFQIFSVLTPLLHKYGFCHFYARKGLTPLIWRERSTEEFPMM